MGCKDFLVENLAIHERERERGGENTSLRYISNRKSKKERDEEQLR